MELEQRISAFISLGRFLEDNLTQSSENVAFVQSFSRAEHKNPWFTRENIECALHEIVQFLSEDYLRQWIGHFSIEKSVSKRVAVIAEGKTPLDCFPDIACVLLSGNILVLKPSENDSILVTSLLLELVTIEPGFTKLIEIQNGFVSSFDAIIMPNTNSTLKSYLQKYPHIVRDEKTSVAILNGQESEEDLIRLGSDIFRYFGLGKQSVSKLYIPTSFDVTRILDALVQYNSVAMHYKYMNNYDYNKSIYLVTQQAHLDNGFLILKEDSALKSPLAVVFYEKYSDISQVQKSIENQKNLIQYVVGTVSMCGRESVPFGGTQQLNIDDYNETITFLTNQAIL